MPPPLAIALSTALIAALALVAAVQVFLAVRVARQFAQGIHARRIPLSDDPAPFTVSVILPVLNEEDRLTEPLRAVLAEARAVPEIVEILIVDGGSTDGTARLVHAFQEHDDRLQFVDVSPVPADAAGKAWGLRQGVARARGDWVLTLDADTVIARGLTRSLSAFAHAGKLDALSVATRQACPGWLQSMVHPAFLTTLVYRFGPPGYATRDPRRVMANGQCFFASRAVLDQSNALEASLSSLCEDITIARTLAKAGTAVGFFEADVPVEVQMYSSAREVWANWPRSLVMRDHHSDRTAILHLARVILLQAAPLPLLVAALILGLPVWFVALQAVLFTARLGVLGGTHAAYTHHAPTFWLSPLADWLVALRLLHAHFQRRVSWRGRIYTRDRHGTLRGMDPAEE